MGTRRRRPLLVDSGEHLSLRYDCDLHAEKVLSLRSDDLAGGLIVDLITLTDVLFTVDHREAVSKAAIANNKLLELVPAGDYRLAITVTLQAPDGALREIERLGSDPRVGAVAVALLNARLSESRFQSILEAAAARELPVMVHSLSAFGRSALAAQPACGPASNEAEMFIDFPLLGWSTLSSLIGNGIFVRFPNLKVILAGFGFAWARSLQWRMDQAWAETRTSAPWLIEWPRNYMRRHIRFGTNLRDEGPLGPYLRDLLEAEFADMVCLTTGGDAQPNIEVETFLGTLNAATRRKIEHDNAHAFVRH